MPVLAEEFQEASPDSELVIDFNLASRFMSLRYLNQGQHQSLWPFVSERS